MLDKNCEVYLFWVVRHAQEIIHAQETLDEILSNNAIQLFVHVTAKPDLSDENSFFFIETLKLFNEANQGGKAPSNSQIQGGLESNGIGSGGRGGGHRIELCVNLTGSLIPTLNVRFGRPNWFEEFSNIKTTGTRWIFACARTEVCSDVAAATESCTEQTGDLFVLTTEEF